MGGRLSGGANPNARLTADQVAQVRGEWTRGNVTCADLARRFDVGQRTIYGIVRGETYKDGSYKPPPNTSRATKKGEKHPGHRLTESQVLEIKQLIADGGMTLTAIGARFGVTRSHVGAIKAGRFWRHVKA